MTPNQYICKELRGSVRLLCFVFPQGDKHFSHQEAENKHLTHTRGDKHFFHTLGGGQNFHTGEGVKHLVNKNSIIISKSFFFEAFGGEKL